ncbi:MAG: GNAT family N-acetyltransferase [Thermoplasmatota archaeon]
MIELWKKFMEHQRGLGRAAGEDLLPKMKENAPEIVGKYFERSIRSRHGYVLVLEDGGSIKGYMLSRIQKNVPVFKDEWIGYLSDIYLEEPYRGRGYASKMWEQTLEWFRSKGINTISIRVLCCNPSAREVYSRWGFTDLLLEMNTHI